MTKHATIRTLALSLVLASSAAHAGLFSKKAKPAPPPPPEPAPVVAPLPPPPPPAPIPLEFSGIQSAAPLPAAMDRLQNASLEVLDTVQWISASKDNAGLPFVVVDKVNARVYAFTPHAQLKATAPVLLGGGVGDKILVGPDVPMSAIPEHKRITPAGRYPSKLVKDEKGKVVLLIDGPNLITMHIVAKGTPVQRRAERLTSPTPEDNRVSFGCINVPPAFFTTVLDPDFRATQGIVYVLPEKTTPGQMFGFQPVPVAAPVPTTAVAASVTSPVSAPFTSAVTAPVTGSFSAAVTAPLTAPVTASASVQASSVAPELQPLPQAPQAAPASAFDVTAPSAAPVAR